MPNPQQPELARARRSDAVTDDALPTKAAMRSKKGATVDAVGPVPEANRPGHHAAADPDKPLVPPDQYRLHPIGDTVAGGAAGAGGRPTGESTVRYPFTFDPVLLPFCATVGVLPATTWVRLDEERLEVRYGPWAMRTSRSNVIDAEVTGPYLPWKVGGPPRLSLRDGGVTFATNRRAGACIHFREPVAALLPWGLVRHGAATVTVGDPHDLVRRLVQDG